VCTNSQGFEEVNGTSQVPNSDIPSWVIKEADAKKGAHAPAPAPAKEEGGNHFVIPVKHNDSSNVAAASSLSSGEQTCECSGSLDSPSSFVPVLITSRMLKKRAHTSAPLPVDDGSNLFVIFVKHDAGNVAGACSLSSRKHTHKN